MSHKPLPRFGNTSRRNHENAFNRLIPVYTCMIYRHQTTTMIDHRTVYLYNIIIII